MTVTHLRTKCDASPGCYRPAAENGGAEILGGQERDGVFEGDEYIHVVECTISPRRDKAIEDHSKIDKLLRQLRAKHPDKFIKGWFVTLAEPTADQRGVFSKDKNRIIPISFDQFRGKLVDARSYLSCRKDYAFGSVRDPETGKSGISINYVPLDIIDDNKNLHDLKNICDGLIAGNVYLLLGDYGAGKSATMRELYFKLKDQFISNKSMVFPLLLNLRDHHGQNDPVEAIERHARNVGFSAPSTLVRAWRAGYVVLMLDGFDEIAAPGWAGKTKKLRDLRYHSMELLRAFIRQTPEGRGVIIAGRAHFFDSRIEMEASLGIASKKEKKVNLNLSEFDDEQIKKYLADRGWSQAVPDWVPARPLLLGYLASRNLLQETLKVAAGSGPAAGWHVLLERISEREAEIEAGIDPGTVRRLIEKIATLARGTADGLGPVSSDQIFEAFVTVCGYPPDDRGTVLLQRLPGLGGSGTQDGSRILIDQDFAEAARGGAIFSFIENPFDPQYDPESWQCALQPLGVDMAAYRCKLANFFDGKVCAAFTYAVSKFSSHVIAADVFLTMNQLGVSYDQSDISVKEVLFPEISFESDSPNLSSIQLHECVVGRLELPAGIDEHNLPTFRKSLFGAVEGRVGSQDLPSAKFVDCSIDSFEQAAETTNAILDLHLPMGAKVMLTVLKKIFAQRGHGRRESALYRGLDARARELVPECLKLLQKEHFAIPSKQGDRQIWMPTKYAGIRKRALSILASPNVSTDPLMLECRNITQ